MALIVILFILSVILIGPYGLLLSQYSLDFQFDTEDFWWAFKNTVFQSLGSALFSVSFGVLGGMGLLWLRRQARGRTYFFLEKALLFPAILPSLFVIIACLGFIEPFPYGKIGIIIIHTVMNIGLISVMFSHLCSQKLASLGALSLIEGASRWQFFRAGVLGYLAPDLVYLFLFVFSMSMVSFNVPLLVGGSSGTTLEVLIYENLVINQNWSAALALSLIQILLLSFISLLSRPSHVGFDLRGEPQVLELAEWKWGLVFPVGALAMMVLPPLAAFPRGLVQLKAIDFQWWTVMVPMLNSLLLGLASGLTLFLLMMGAAFAYSSKGWQRFLMFYLPPGPVLLGFAFFILAQTLPLPIGVQIVLGLAVMFFVSLYRLSLASALASLKSQIEVAQVMGASAGQIFVSVVFPQIMQPLVFACGIGSMWASGDFALSTVLSSEDFHLALMVKSLAGSYRLDAAQALMFLLYGVSLLAYLFWWRLGNVVGRKFNR